MRDLPTGLQEHLHSGATSLCWCWKLTRGDGVSLGFTDHDELVRFDGLDFEAFSGFTASEITSSLGLSVDNLDVEGALSSDHLEEKHISAGLYDDAAVEIWRVNWKDTSQRLLMRSGSLGEISRGQTYFRAEIRGLGHKLQQPQGRIYQRTCDVELGSAKCGVDLNTANFNSIADVHSGQGADSVLLNGLGGFDDGWFDRGVVAFTSGKNDGGKYSIRSHRAVGDRHLVSVWGGFGFEVEPGDLVELTVGCDKRIETCAAKFSNAINFRGFPHMPSNDFVTQYPNQGDEGLDGVTRFDEY